MTENLAIHLEIPVIITYRDKTTMPSIELRRKTSDLNLMKKIITAAFYNRPLVILPKFTDRLQSINNLMEKGIIYYNPEHGQYFFNI